MYHMVSGIYKITNTITLKFYIGSSYNIFQRWSRHKSLKSHTCKKLFASFMKFGIDKFSFEIIEEISNLNLTFQELKNNLLEREQYYLDTLYPFDEYGYNINKLATSPLGNKYPNRKSPIPYKRSIESRIKASGINGWNNKCINRYSSSLEFLEEHYNITDAARHFNTTVQSIVRCCQGKNKTAGGFIWAYKGNLPILPTPHKSKQVGMYDTQGTLLCTFINVKVAANHINKHYSPIYECCRGEKERAYGYIWKWIL